MSKAIKFLKENEIFFQELMDAYGDSQDYVGDCDYEATLETLGNIKECITELEAQEAKNRQYKECRICKNINCNKYNVIRENLGKEHLEDFYCNAYEPKDN